MWRESWILLYFLMFGLLLPFRMVSQINDCIGAQVICSDGAVDYEPTGPGRNDFANPNNDAGCLLVNESQSAWYYFEFREDMPPNSIIEFTITPYGGNNEDYDFAIFGPNLSCDSLGSPIRCSFAVHTCTLCPQTGLGKGATDTSEPAYDSDGFVAPMVVQPGDGYYLLLDNFKLTARGFQLTWGGSAAPYLNCLANPYCRSITVSAGPDKSVCSGSAPFRLEGSAKGVGNNARYEWIGTPEALSFLDRTDIPQPTVTVPADFTGTLQYVLSIANAECVLADDVYITVVDNKAPQITGNNIICSGESTILDAGEGFQSYRWSNGATTRTISVSDPGIYSVTVTNANNCSNNSSFEVRRADTPQPNITGGTVICLDDPLRLDAGNHTSYLWSTGATTRTIDVLLAGNYRVTVTNQNGCQGVGEVNVTEARKPDVEVLGDTFICFGESTTLRTNQVFQNYAWSNGANTPTIDASASGTYTVTVTDVNGCRDTADLSIVKNNELNIRISGELEFCEGNSTQLTATSGFADYRWSNNTNQPTIGIDTGGTYHLTVTDVNGCSATTSVDIIEHPTPAPVLRSPSGICPDSTVRIETNDIHSSYLWSNGVTTPFIEVRQSGTYSLQVTSQAGCIGNADITLGQFPAVQAEIRGDLTFCPDIGGTLETTQPFVAYRWSNLDTAAVTRVFSDGTYFVTVTDSNGCSGTDNITVDAYEVESPPLSRDTSFCSGTVLELDAGVDFPQYRWSTGATTRSIAITNGGVYTLIVTDVNNCNATATFTVQENAIPNLQIEGPQDLCIGDTIEIHATGNFTALRWSDNSTTASLRISQPATYSVTATDANGCSNQDSRTIAGLEKPAPVIETPGVICDGEPVALRVNASFPQIIWNTGQNQQEIMVSQGGTYIVEVEATNGCRNSTSADIIERTAPQIEISGAPFFCQDSSTTLEVTPGDFTYQWSTGVNQSSITVADPGIYSITITDDAGCATEKSVNVLEIPLPDAYAGSDTSLNCNHTSIRLGNTVNGSNLSYEWSGPGITDANRFTPNPEVSISGSYTLVTTDQTYGCQSEESTVLVSDRSYVPIVNLQATEELDCQTASIVIDGSQSQNGSNLIYRWLNERREPINNGNSQQLTVNEPGKYYLQIIDNQLGCSNTDSIEIKANYDLPNAEAGAAQVITCADTEAVLDGSASATGSTFSYTWTTANGNIRSGSTTKMPVINQAGTYILTVRNNDNGCISTDSVLVIADQTLPIANAGEDQQLDCNIPDVILDGSASNGGARLRYEWAASNGFQFTNPNLPSVNVNQPGVYALLVTNLDNGCFAVDSVVVTDDSDYPTDVQAQLVDPLCLDDKNGKIIVEQVTGGTPPFVYSLNGAPFEPTDHFDGLAAGEYRLTVEDVAGCRYQTKFLLKDGMTLRVDLGYDALSVTPPKTISLEPVVNVPRRDIVAMRWEANEEAFDTCVCWKKVVEPVKNSYYELTVINNLGCQASDSFLVTLDSTANIYIPTAFSPNNDGYNDVFMIYTGAENLQVKFLRIFDRWGNQVFEATDFYTNDPNFGWDGTSKGKKQNADVYVFVTEIVIFGDVTQKFAREINLIR